MTTKYTNPAETLADILCQKYLGMKCQIHYDEKEHFIYGILIWPGFEGLANTERLSKILDVVPQDIVEILKFDGFKFHTPKEINEMQRKFNYEDFPFDIYYFEDSFAKAFPGMELQLEHLETNNKSYGAVIWDGFGELPKHIRNMMVDSILRVIMHDDIKDKYIGNIIAMTPEEVKLGDCKEEKTSSVEQEFQEFVRKCHSGEKLEPRKNTRYLIQSEKVSTPFGLKETIANWDGEPSLGSDDGYPPYEDEEEAGPWPKDWYISYQNWKTESLTKEFLGDIFLNAFSKSLSIEEIEDYIEYIFKNGFNSGENFKDD